MKSINELVELLFVEFENCSLDYDAYGAFQNDFLKDVPVIISYVIENILIDFAIWNEDEWADDSLITKYYLNEDRINLSGFLIFGKGKINNEWVEPFDVEFFILDKNEQKCKILLNIGNTEQNSLVYSDFRNKNDYSLRSIKWKHKLIKNV